MVKQQQGVITDEQLQQEYLKRSRTRDRLSLHLRVKESELCLLHSTDT